MDFPSPVNKSPSLFKEAITPPKSVELVTRRFKGVQTTKNTMLPCKIARSLFSQPAQLSIPPYDNSLNHIDKSLIDFWENLSEIDYGNLKNELYLKTAKEDKNLRRTNRSFVKSGNFVLSKKVQQASKFIWHKEYQQLFEKLNAGDVNNLYKCICGLISGKNLMILKLFFEENAGELFSTAYKTKTYSQFIDCVREIKEPKCRELISQLNFKDLSSLEQQAWVKAAVAFNDYEGLKQMMDLEEEEALISCFFNLETVRLAIQCDSKEVLELLLNVKSDKLFAAIISNKSEIPQLFEIINHDKLTKTILGCSTERLLHPANFNKFKQSILHIGFQSLLIPNEITAIIQNGSKELLNGWTQADHKGRDPLSFFCRSNRSFNERSLHKNIEDLPKFISSHKIIHGLSVLGIIRIMRKSTVKILEPQSIQVLFEKILQQDKTLVEEYLEFFKNDAKNLVEGVKLLSAESQKSLLEIAENAFPLLYYELKLQLSPDPHAMLMEMLNNPVVVPEGVVIEENGFVIYSLQSLPFTDALYFVKTKWFDEYMSDDQQLVLHTQTEDFLAKLTTGEIFAAVSAEETRDDIIAMLSLFSESQLAIIIPLLDSTSWEKLLKNTANQSDLIRYVAYATDEQKDMYMEIISPTTYEPWFEGWLKKIGEKTEELKNTSNKSYAKNELNQLLLVMGSRMNMLSSVERQLSIAVANLKMNSPSEELLQQISRYEMCVSERLTAIKEITEEISAVARKMAEEYKIFIKAILRKRKYVDYITGEPLSDPVKLPNSTYMLNAKTISQTYKYEDGNAVFLNPVDNNYYTADHFPSALRRSTRIKNQKKV